MLRELYRDTAAQVSGGLDLMAVMITVISAGVTGYVGIQIMDDTESTTDFNTSQDAGNQTAFENGSEDLGDGLADFFSNLGTVFTVIILVVILSYLMLLRGR